MRLVYNNNYPLKEPPVSLDSLTRQNRVVIFGEEFFIASEPLTADRKAERLDRRYEILSPTLAAEKYPKYFSKSVVRKAKVCTHLVSVKLSEEQVEFCQEKGDGRIAPYIRSLIDEKMKDESDER